MVPNNEFRDKKIVWNFEFILKLSMIQDTIQTVKSRFYTVININNYGSKQGTVTWSLHPVELEFPVTSRRKGTCCVCCLRNWSLETGKHPPGLQGNQKYDCSSPVATRRPATSGLGLLSYSLQWTTCWLY